MTVVVIVRLGCSFAMRSFLGTLFVISKVYCMWDLTGDDVDTEVIVCNVRWL